MDRLLVGRFDEKGAPFVRSQDHVTTVEVVYVTRRLAGHHVEQSAART
jgi:hypothetical protein